MRGGGDTFRFSLRPSVKEDRMKSLSKAMAVFAVLVMTFAVVSVIPGDVEAVPTDKWADTENYDTSWYDGHESEDSYILSDEEDLAGLAVLVNGGNTFDGKTVTLAEGSYDLSGHLWTPIGNSPMVTTITDGTKVFSGTFDGSGSTIAGLTISETMTDQTDATDGNDPVCGLFGFLCGATVSNLVLENVSVSLTVSATNSTADPIEDSVGALAGFAYGKVSISNVTVAGGKVTGYDSAGGILARSYGESITIEDCVNGADIVSTFDGYINGGVYGGGKSGGIVGIISTVGNETCSSTVEGCTTTGDSTARFAGGITGLTNASIGTHSITGCHVRGITVDATEMAGGMTARGATGVTIEQCTVDSSTITSDNVAAGIVGGNGGVGNTIVVEGCNVTGTESSRTTVSALTTAAGIIASVMADDTDITGCFLSHTDISATDKDGKSVAGAVIGETATSGTHSLDIDVSDVTFDSVTLDVANHEYCSNNTYCGELTGTAVANLGGNGNVLIDNVQDLADYEMVAQANFTGEIIFQDCETARTIEWMVAGLDPQLILRNTHLGGFQVDTQSVAISSDDGSFIGELIAGAVGVYEKIEGCGIYEGDHNPTGMPVVGSGQTLKVGTAFQMPMLEVPDSNGEDRRQYSGSIVGTDATSTLIVTESGDGDGYMSPGVYTWSGQSTESGSWTQASYTVIFDPNGGEGTPTYQTIEGESAKLDPNTFTRDGYAFAGWNTSADGSGTPYGNGDDFTKGEEGGSTILYAQWVEGVDFSEFAGEYYFQNDGSYILGAEFDTTPNDSGSYDGEFYTADGTATQVTVDAAGLRQQLSSGLCQIVYSAHPVSNPDYAFTIYYPEDAGAFEYGMKMDHREYIFPGESGTVDLWRGGGEYVSYTTEPELGFVPYYLEEAVKFPTGSVSIVLGSGTYDLVADFNGTELSISAADGAEVRIGGMRLNSNSDDASLTLDGLIFDGADNGNVAVGHFSDVTLKGCTVTDRVVTMSLAKVSGSANDKADPGTFAVTDCTLKNTSLDSDLYAITASNEKMVIEGNTIDGYARGVNLQGPGTGGGSMTVTGNTISNLTTEGEGAVQVADGVEGMTVTIKENTISDCQAAVAIHNGCSGTPASVTVEENGVTGTPVGILYKSGSSGECATQVVVDADNNLFVGADGIATAINVSSESGVDVSSSVICDTWYVDSDKDLTNEDVTSDVTLTDGYSDPIVEEGTSVTLLASVGAEVHLDVTLATGSLRFDGIVNDLAVTVSIVSVPAPADVDAMYDVRVTGVSATGLYEVTLPFANTTGSDAYGVNVYYYPEVETRGEQMAVTSFDEGEVSFLTPHNSLYGIEVVNSSYIPPIWDDDDDYVPMPVPQPSEGSGGNDTTTIVACAAAAVVAALMAVFLIIERRRN